MTRSPIEHDDALAWLARQEPDSAKVIVWDPLGRLENR